MDTSAEARVIASFTFIVALLLGAWGALDAWIAQPYSMLGEGWGSIVVALVPFAATAVAFRAARSAEPAWARTLGGAAVMLGVLASMGGVLYFFSNG